MQITSLKKDLTHYLLHTDEEFFPIYRRALDGNWQNLIMMIWRPVEEETRTELEPLFQEKLIESSL